MNPLKPVVREITDKLPQINVAVKVRIAGSGRLQASVNALNPDAFGIMMSGLQSEMKSFIHGSFREQILGLYGQLITEASEPHIVRQSSTVGDDVARFSCSTQVTFGWLLPNQLMQEAAFALAQTFFTHSAKSVTLAQHNLIHAAMQTQQAEHAPEHLGMSPTLVQQLQALGMPQSAPIMMTATAPADAGSNEQQAGPGQYL